MEQNDLLQRYDAWADYYDLIDFDRSGMISFYRGIMDEKTGSVLELACGTGTMTIGFATHLRQRKLLHQVVGLDSSPRMLEQASRRDSGIEWGLGGMRDPPLQSRFDFVFCSCNILAEF